MREQILSSALYLAAKTNYQKITRKQISERAGCAESLVSFHFGPMRDLRKAVLLEAIEKENLAIIAQGLAARDHALRRCPEGLRRRAVEKLALGV